MLTAGDGVDLFGKTIERTVEDAKKSGRDGGIQLENVGKIVHSRVGVVDYIPHAEINLWQRKDGDTGVDQLAGRWHGGGSFRLCLY